MLPTIHLDNKLPVAANKVHHIRADRLLAYKLEATKPPVTHREPQFHFGIGRIAPKAASSYGGLPVGTTHQLPLTRLAPSALGTLSPLSRGEGWECAAPSGRNIRIVQQLSSVKNESHKEWRPKHSAEEPCRQPQTAAGPAIVSDDP